VTQTHTETGTQEAGRREGLDNLPRLEIDSNGTITHIDPLVAALSGLELGQAFGHLPNPEPKFVRLGAARGLLCGRQVLLLPEGVDDEVRIPCEILQEAEVEIVVCDAQDRILYANRLWRRERNLPETGDLGPLAAHLPLHEALREAAADARLRAEGGRHSELLSERQAKGSMRHLRKTKFLLPASETALALVVTRTEDVSEAVEQVEEQRFADLVIGQSLDAILVTDPNLRLRSVNPAFQRMTGFSSASVLGKTLAAVIVETKGRLPWLQIALILRGEGRWQGEMVLRSSAGAEVIVWCSASQILDKRGRQLGYAFVQSDLTRLYRVQAENERLARFDTLTHLPNRQYILERIEETLRLRPKGCALLFLDLDEFKSVNDSLGHAAGDAVLLAVAGRLTAAVPPGATVARIGGDEFLILLPDAGAQEAMARARGLLAALGASMELDGFAGYRTGASIGIALAPDHGRSVPELLRSADTAMYAAKEQRSHIALYDSAMRQEAARLLDLRNALTGAVGRGEFCLHYQPILRLVDRCVVGAEALLRWNRPGLGLSPPREFLAVAESAGMMRDIDAWVLEQAIAELGQWRAAGLVGEGWALSVNQTAEDLADPFWADRLERAMRRAGLGGEALQIELTEGQVAGPDETVQHNLRALGAMGVRLAVDDFGTGYSNLQYLRSLPISTIKIDRSFISGVDDDANDRMLIQAMQGLGRQFGYATLAEGIETEAQADLLTRLGCDLGQGFHFSPPLSGPDLIAYVAESALAPV
jgi:diguanylate cyclase (GGDEF)-like protein/PAS domain S-box-containing protein